MKTRVLLVSLALIHGASAGEAEKALALGQSARADGVPQAAISALQSAASARNAPAAAVIELARCLIEADREQEAIDWLAKTPHRDEAEVAFWRAQALAQKGDYAAALADYNRAVKDDFPLRQEAELGRARMLEALGRESQALAIYRAAPADSPWRDSAALAAATLQLRSGQIKDARQTLSGIKGGARDAKELRQYLEAQTALAAGDSAGAWDVYEDFDPKNRRLAAGGAIGEAEVLARGNQPEKAEARLEAFIRDNPRSPLIDVVLAKLDEIRAQEKEPSNTALKQWEKDEASPELSALATFYLARGDDRQGRPERAMRNYAEFMQAHPNHPLRDEAAIRLARIQLTSGHAAEALATLAPSGRSRDAEARLSYLRGEAQYQLGRFGDAVKSLVGAANIDESLAEPALSNAALAAIAAGNEPLAAEILNALRKQSSSAARRVELANALASARAGNPDAAEQLAWLADRGGAIGDKARLALAEWRWMARDAVGARAEFRRVSNSTAAGSGDQKGYFAVYLADDGSARAVDAVTREAQDFLALHPDSPHAAEVRMKWGEVLMRAGDYRGARVQFEQAAQSAGDPSLQQSAKFLAARAAVGSMQPEEIGLAITALEDVAKDKNSPLAEQARLEQALLQSTIAPKDSLTILDGLATSTKDERLQFTARLKKAEVLFAMGAKDATKIQDAIREWRALAADADALPAERNEALTRAAAASEQSGDLDGALADYYAVLTAPRDKQPEYFWYYKAGFEAAKLLSDHNRLKEAAAIYDKMAAAPGPRADDAKQRVKRLRLENFIWED
jgi:predicted negative regulator of RcsB-dependent stress response